MKTNYLKIVSAAVILVNFTLITSISAKTIRYVKIDGTGDGSSWANASNNIQYMIDDSAIGDQVWVASGTYIPINSKQFDFSRSGVSICGGFVGNETELTQRKLADINSDGKIDSYEFVNNTILKTFADNYQVIYCFSETTIDGLFITGGKANLANSGFQNSGGGIFAYGATITNCTISDCYAIENGGGIYAVGNSKISNCLVTNCNAYKDGGGIYASSSIVTNCTIINCTSTHNNSYQSGGGVYADNSLVSKCVVLNCSVGKYSSGGGIYSYGNSSSVIDCSITNCIAKQNGGGIVGHNISNCKIYNCKSTINGGGIYTITYSNKTTTVMNCIIDSCLATNGGGVYVSPTEGTYNFKIEVSYCDINDCIASKYGGGISTELPSVNSSFSYTKNYFPQIAFCSIKGCTSSRGGGIFAVHKVAFCNVSNSTASEYGGGIYAPYSSAVINSTVTNCSTSGSGGGIYAQAIANCVIANCNATTWGGVYSNALNSTSINNAISNNMTNGRVTSGVSFSVGHFSPVIFDTYIQPTSFIGIATTDTQKQELSTANWCLKEGSPCINSGVITNIIDDRSVIRYGIIDIGAFEYNVPIVNIPTVENFNDIADWNSSSAFYNSAQLNGSQNIMWNISNQKATFSKETNLTSNYSQSIFTYQVDARNSSKVFLRYDMSFQAYGGTISTLGTEKLSVEYSTDFVKWSTIYTYSNANASISNRNYKHELSSSLAGKTFFIRFNANGVNSNRIEKWEIDNVIIDADGVSAVNTAHEYKYKYAVSNNGLSISNLENGDRIQLFDVNGKLLNTKSAESQNTQLTLPVRGVYLVKVSSDSGVENKKVVW